MRLLITRPEPGASDFAKHLQPLGIESAIMPVLAYEALPFACDAVRQFDALAFTSAEAVRVFARQCEEQAMPVFAVGEKTAGIAKELGFACVHSADGNSEDLIALLPPDSRTLHLCSADTPPNRMEQHIIYRAVFTKPDIVRVLAEHTPDGVAFFSARSAKSFTKLIQTNRLAGHLAALDAFCLSPKVERALLPDQWKSVRVADRPDAAAMLDLLTHW